MQGRPSKYTEELVDQICALLATGMSLKRVCEREEMPELKTVYNWLHNHDSFLQKYARAKQDSADAMANELEDIADRVLRGELDPNAARVAADIIKWSASKLKPKKYGDKLDMTTNGKDLPTPIYAGLSKTPTETPPK
jgi:hypothetical protein